MQVTCGINDDPSFPNPEFKDVVWNALADLGRI